MPLYPYKFQVIITNDKDKLNKIIPDFDDIYATSCDWNNKGKRCFSIVLNFNNKRTKLSHGVIAHESVHIVNFVFDNIGAKQDFNNDEPYAYLVGWVTDQVYKFMYKKGFNIE